MSDKYNKDEESFIQKIQNKTGCLFLVIGVAMLAFVLTDLTSSGGSIFGSTANSVGTIGGEQIAYDDFNNRFEAMKQQIAQNNPGFVMSEDISKQYNDEAWNLLIQSKTIDLEYEKLGIDVSPAELEDLTIGNNTDPQIMQSFTNPETGQPDKQRLVRFLKEDINQDPNAKASWLAFQNQFVAGLKAKKYSTLIGGSYYATDLDAKYKNLENSKTINASVVALPYAQNADSSITVSDSEILSYAKEYKDKYEQKASRDIEYIKIDVTPSREDSAKMMEWGTEVAEKFRNEKDDSAFVSIMSSETPYDPSYKVRGTFSADIENKIFGANLGEVVGPLEKNGTYSVFKVTDSGTDTLRSVKGSHIQFGVAGIDTAKAEGEARELLAKIRSGATTFEAEAATKNFDASRATGGDMGWVREGSGAYPTRLINRLFNSGVDNYVVVRSSRGVHLAKATSSVSRKTVQVALIDQTIYPSTKTDGESYKKAGQLLTRVNKENSFESVAETLVLTKRVAGKVTESNPAIPALKNPSKLTRWLFDAEISTGDISPILDMNGSYVVAHLVKINEEGLPSAEDLRVAIEPLVKNRKLGEQLKSKVETALANASSADALAKELGTVVSALPAASFGASNIPYVGQDDAISGAIFGVPVGGHSDIIVGKSAVAVVYVNNENEYQKGDLTIIKDQISREGAQEARGLASEALKRKAEVKDQRYRFYD